jgi:hypothetical protein
MSKTKSLKRRGKFLVALLTVTAAFAGGTQAVSPASAATRIYDTGCESVRADWWAWQQCELDNGGPRHF